MSPPAKLAAFEAVRVAEAEGGTPDSYSARDLFEAVAWAVDHPEPSNADLARLLASARHDASLRLGFHALLVVDAARAMRLAKSGEERARALSHLFVVVDAFDGATSVAVT